MANGYGNSSINIKINKINAEGKMAPPGFHHMPDGSLMSDAEHVRLYGEDSKIISNFDLDLSDMKASGESRDFNIIGDNGSGFILEIKNEDNYYYNFTTNAFQAIATKLEKSIEGNVYRGSITFPTITDDDQYDIYLYALPGTKHIDYKEVRFEDGSIDINSSEGSSSLMMQKVIYQYTDLTLTLQPLSLNNVTDLIKTSTRVDDVITVSRGKTYAKVPFTISCETNVNTKCYQIIKQPTQEDIIGFTGTTVGSAPEILPGENEYPTARAAFTGDDVNGAVTSGSVVRMDAVDLSAVIEVGDKITADVSTDTVDGAISSSDTVVMDNNGADKAAVGDRVFFTGYDSIYPINNNPTEAKYFTHNVVVVASIGGGGNPKQITMALDTVGGSAASATIADGSSLTFVPACNSKLVTVTDVETSGTATDFTMSATIQLRDNLPLTFTPRKNYQWPVNNVVGIKQGMILLPSTNGVANTVVSSYEDTTTLFEGTEQEYTIVNNSAEAINTKNKLPTVTNGVITGQEGNIVFNNQQPFAFAGDNLRIGGYGEDIIKSATGYDIKFSNLKIKLDEITTTTTAAVYDSTSVPITSRNGILDNVSEVSGIGIDASAINPTVSSGAGAVSGSGTIVLSAAQNLESGTTLTFANAGQKATITGDIEILKVGTSTSILYFDMEKLLSIT